MFTSYYRHHRQVQTPKFHKSTVSELISDRKSICSKRQVTSVPMKVRQVKSQVCLMTIATSDLGQYVCPSGFFHTLPIIRISRNAQGRCTLDKVASGHRSRGCRVKVKVTPDDKLVILVHFFVLLRTSPTVLIGLSWEC